MSELDAAWDAALDAPADDQRPWRVLADMLLSEGSVQGEWMQLELDAELGPPRGLARGRLQRLREEGPRAVLPPGVGAHGAVFLRAAPVQLECTAEQLHRSADTDAWRSVHRLRVFFSEHPKTRADVPRVPLAGNALRRIERLASLPPAALEVLLEGPARPRLSTLGLTLWGRAPPSSWAATCAALLARQPGLQQLSLRDLPAAPEAQGGARLEEVLGPLVAARVARLDLGLAVADVGRLWAWRRATRPAFTLAVTLGPGRLDVELTDDALQLRLPPAQVPGAARPDAAELKALAADAQARLRLNWWAPAGPLPRVRGPA